MTQAELAASDFTKGFISLIETGRTRVSLRAAEILAKRLGTSAPELMTVGAGSSGVELEVLLLRAEQLVAAGRASDSLELVDRVAAEATGILRARALRTRGRALVEIGRPREGLAALEEAGRSFEALGQPELMIRTTYDRAVAHAHLDEPGVVLVLAMECANALRSGTVVDRTLELQVRTLLAATFARSGDLGSADLQARQALELAQDVVDIDALGTLYSTLSLARQRQNDMEGALSYARKSLALYEGLGRERAIAQMWHNLASIYLQQRDFRRAEEAIGRAERVTREIPMPPVEARLLSLRAELALAQRRTREALTLSRAAVEHRGASAKTRGRSLIVQARALAAQRASIREIREVFAQAMTALENEPARVRSEAHASYAEILHARGDWRAAYEQSHAALSLGHPKLR
jgi:tetratricopeptide (TPR) repeat protein